MQVRGGWWAAGKSLQDAMHVYKEPTFDNSQAPVIDSAAELDETSSHVVLRS